MYQDFSTVAGFYSQLAGVLAGFAFASLIALIIAQLTAGSQATYALQSFAPLLATFIGLVATSLNYGIVSGEKSVTSRAAALETAAGGGFCVAAYMLFYSILVLLRGVEADAALTAGAAAKVANLLRATMLFAIAPLLIFLMYGGTFDHLTIKYHRDRGILWLDVAILIIFLIVCAAVLLFWHFYRNIPRPTIRLTSWLSGASISISAMSVALTTALLLIMDDEDLQWDGLPFIEVCIVAGFVLVAAYEATRYEA